MFYPNSWIRPRLRSFCVAFGGADVTLVLISTIGWYFFFEIGYKAQQDQVLLQFRGLGHKSEGTPAQNEKLFPYRDDRTEDDRRLRRTVRACGLAHAGQDDELDRSFGAPEALIGTSMGGYAILGALLAWLGLLDTPRARKLVCTICLVGENLCTLFLFMAVTMLFGNESLCPTEYYFEGYQPLYQTFIYALIFIFSYKTYEITVILFYLSQQTKLVLKEVEANNALRRSARLPRPDRRGMEPGEYVGKDDK